MVKMEDRVYSEVVEKEILEFWEKNKVYQEAKKRRVGKKPYYFLKGPPYATGFIHVGHLWNLTWKDIYLRYHRLKGEDVFDKMGWDSHGLPIEHKVEKLLGIKSKKEIEEYGVDKFVEKCREFALKHVGDMTRQMKDLGLWLDFDNPYITCTDEYIETQWWVFKQGYEKGLIYRGKYPVHVCPRCETVVANAELEYKDVEDPSLFVALPARDGRFLLVWTTTPWTLPANVAVMVHPEETYVDVEVDGKIYVVAEKRLEAVAKEVGWKEYNILRTYPGKELEGLEYEHPLREYVPALKDVKHRVVLSERFVSMEDGTGLVHTAPGHGMEDYLVGKEYGLPVISLVGIDGRFLREAGKYAGKRAKGDADEEILEDLRRKGVLVHLGRIKHSYPHCWRCETPLLLTSVDEWFIAVEKFRKHMEEEAKKVRWVPDWARDRFLDWVRNLRDWPVSRQRYWGAPIPVWICKKCGEIVVVGSKEELLNMAKKVPEHLELHRPWIDEVVLRCPKCGGDMVRTPEVFDVWFDSGVAPWAALDYPRRKDLYERFFPVELEIEAAEQVRGWFNSQMVAGHLVEGGSPYRTVLFTGFILDVHGLKMSKSKGNVILPEDVYSKYSRDALRMYYVFLNPGVDQNFDWEKVKAMQGHLNYLWNVHRLLARYIAQGLFDPSKEVTYRAPEDHWILSRLESTKKKVYEAMDNYRHAEALRAIIDLYERDLSKTYIKIVRERLRLPQGDPSREAALKTIYDVLYEVLFLTAPFTPFIAEAIYQNLYKERVGEDSLFYLTLPPVREHRIKGDLEKAMEIVLAAAEKVLALRHKNGIRLRWPIPYVYVEGEVEAFKKLKDAFLSLVNAKELVFEPRDDMDVEEFEGGKVGIAKKLPPELVKEGLAREVLRRVQQTRKELGLIETQKIIVEIWGDNELLDAVKTYEHMIKERAGVKSIVYSEEQMLEGRTWEFSVDGRYLRITVKVV